MEGHSEKRAKGGLWGGEGHLQGSFLVLAVFFCFVSFPFKMVETG
jgi:hypothetical protein